MAQPDVSAFTILEMLRQVGHDPNLLQAALGSVYEQVRVLGPAEFDLRRDGQPYATVQCADQLCVFQYRDHGARTDAFAVQATMWAETHVGPMNGDWPARTAAGGGLRLEMVRTASGPESEILLKLWTKTP